MYRLKEVSWKDLVRRLKMLGFEGPFLSSGPHPYFMRRGDLTVDLPNPHKQDIGVGLDLTIEVAGEVGEVFERAVEILG